ncbi:hypothetical protein CVT26_000491 [Gymnopilus dilepis]|uniref:Tetrapyrrole biosynthesis uroporphyrinogen III synthase domain-containing protein n=1 Tax=Gymnopilus dilepis TaxID=231916 RepID=A0A409VGZ0_9AGAR|nr:hypothetical protein CVT26_000491 [Gymnopilus dilepis]
MPSPVLLLREPTADGPDKYESAFTQAGYTPISVSVLETVLVNVPKLKDLIVKGPTSAGIEGVIVTSKRSCEAWREGLKLAVDTNGTGAEGWLNTAFYVVGQTTQASLNEVFAEFDLPPPDVRGQESGNAAALAPFILKDLKERQPPLVHPKLLYLTGDKNRDTLPKLLKEGGVELVELQAYKTQGSSLFEKNLEAAFDSVLASPGQTFPHSASAFLEPASWWIVYFAPSAAAFVTPILQKHFILSPAASTLADTSASSSKALSKAKVAAIGPTTNTFLLEELKLQVHAMAPKPTPDDIVRVIKRYDANG